MLQKLTSKYRVNFIKCAEYVLLLFNSRDSTILKCCMSLLSNQSIFERSEWLSYLFCGKLAKFTINVNTIILITRNTSSCSQREVIYSNIAGVATSSDSGKSNLQRIKNIL